MYEPIGWSMGQFGIQGCVSTPLRLTLPSEKEDSDMLLPPNLPQLRAISVAAFLFTWAGAVKGIVPTKLRFV